MKNKNLILAAVVAVVVILGWWLLSQRQSEAPAAPQAGLPSEAAAVVTYTDAGYAPATLTVRKGVTVTFENKSSGPMWTASGVHPTHKLYPGSGIEKCGTPEAAGIFDACAGIQPGGSWTFTMNEIGTWKYHNHLNISRTGTFVVGE